MKKKVSLVAVLMLGMFQIVFGQTTAAPVMPELKEHVGYLIGPGDVITAKVLGEPQFDFTAAIGEDGKFQVPFFDKSVMAKCKTDRELRVEVTKLISKYLKDPMVSVAVTERKSRPRVTIYGEVRQIQQIDLQRRATLLDLLSAAGGTTEDAGGMIQVFRTQQPMCSESNEDSGFIASDANGLDVPSRMYSLTSVKQGREQSNPEILPGDIIVVQKAAPVYITGEVAQKTGLHLPEGGLSLSQAIAMVGGVNPQAKTKDISIYRLKANSKDREVISANYAAIKKGTQKDVMLEPYDIVEVDKSKKSVQQIIFETVTGVGRQVLTGGANILPQRIFY
jgi:polysaccharide biosynthesis/export protein